MRIRLPFAAAFFTLLLFASYLGLTPLQLPEYINDKVVHFLTFFFLTLCIYWIPDTTRRRTLHLTLILSLSLSLFSEILQAVLPNGREFDIYDIVANAIGSLAAIGLCQWYHKRMLDRKRRAKGYVIVDNDVEGEGEELMGRGTEDLELGIVDVPGAQENGVVDSTVAPRTTTLDEEVDNWDENGADNWDDEQHEESGDGEGPKTPSASSTGEVEEDVQKKGD